MSRSNHREDRNYSRVIVELVATRLAEIAKDPVALGRLNEDLVRLGFFVMSKEQNDEFEELLATLRITLAEEGSR